MGHRIGKALMRFAGPTPLPQPVHQAPIGLDPTAIGLTPLGFLKNGTPIWPMAGGASLLAVIQDQIDGLEKERGELEAKAEEAGSYDGVRERLSEVDGQLVELSQDAVRERARAQRDRHMPAAEGDKEGPITDLGSFSAELGSLSDRLFASEGWKDFIAKYGDGLRSDSKSRIQSPPVSMKSIIGPPPRQRAALLRVGDYTTGAGELSIPRQTGIFDEALQRPLTIRDVITNGTTDSDVVEYVRITSQTNAAAVVPEADSTTAADETGLKPESAIDFERIQATVKTIAHWIPATKRSLASAGQLRTIVDNFLRYGLEETLEDQIVSGAGGDEFEGLLTNTDVQTFGFDTSRLVTARKARTLVRLNGRARANAYLMHPNDWEDYDLDMTLGGPGTNYRQASEVTQPTLWGLPVVESEAVPEGTAIVGDFRYIVLWDREQASIQASDGVNNFFLKNLVAILAEMSAALGIIRPKAFVAFDLAY